MRIRCKTAGAIALITNPHFCNLEWVRTMAWRHAKDLLAKNADASGLLDLPSADAADLLRPEIARIIKTQKSTGLWRSKNARAISYSLLKALAYAGLLDTVIPQLRYDPYLPLREADDWYGIAVRGQLLHTPRADEQAEKDRLLAQIAGRQLADGSWERTVIAAVHHLEILAETGLADTPCFARGIAFLFTSLQENVQQRQSAQQLAHHMITTDDHAAEFRSAVTYKPHWLPVNACYYHLPVMQNGYALHLLNTTGYADDPRVIAACQNLVDLHERFGGWCASNIHHGLRAEAKKRKAR